MSTHPTTAREQSMSDSTLENAIAMFPGLLQIADQGDPANGTLAALDIADDVSAERNAFDPLNLSELSVDDLTTSFAELQATLQDASKGVTEGTDTEYRR
jgi:hypothetical protein